MEIDPAEQPSVLLVEDNPGDARLIEHSLRNAGTVFERPELTHAESLPAALDELDRQWYDLVLLDLGLPESSALDTLERFQRQVDIPIPVIVLTGLDDQEVALSAIQAGAQDYLVKDDIDGATLERSIRYALARYRQEQELKRQNERLERFASVVSHDLRNPLNVARGTVEALQQNAEGRELEACERAIRAHNRIEDIIEDVLALARQGQAVDETEPISLPVLVADARDVVDAPGLSVSVEEDLVVDADRSRLSQLLENLLRNAVEHGNESVTITIGALDDGFFVADDGPGIPEDEREKIFEPGFTTNDGGTGLGLNIVKEIAEAHGWRVQATESDSGGARFEFVWS